MSLVCYLVCLHFVRIEAYSNQLFTVSKSKDTGHKVLQCLAYDDHRTRYYDTEFLSGSQFEHDVVIEDPYDVIQKDLHTFLYGENTDIEIEDSVMNKLSQNTEHKTKNYLHYVMGNVFRQELYQNKSGVHLMLAEFIHKGHCLLTMNNDYMQTAVNAFAIFLYGTKEDIERLPPNYILQSTRTISMMKIAREKLAATWKVVKGGKQPSQISYKTLELYRPLFKYVNSREMANLNLSDERILTYVGTHPDLNRLQVGVVASRYIKLNKRWTEPRYLNKMNNLLCGIPMIVMRKVSTNNYLQLSHQVFYHITACEPLQRRFFLTMMTKTKALGKSYSWNAQDVSRLGLLLSEVEGPELSEISPEAMAGITPQVMLTIPPQRLQYFTEMQLQYLSHKSLNVLAKKLKKYQDVLLINGCVIKKTYITIYILVSYITIKVILNI